MTLIDFSNNSKQAVMNGFFKGFAAPLMLFGSFESAATIPSITLVQPASQGRGLAGDWTRIGMDLQTVFHRHEQARIAA